MTFLALSYFDEIICTPDMLGLSGLKTEDQPIESESLPLESSPVVEEEAKGKSVDFVFPELSPDKK